MFIFLFNFINIISLFVENSKNIFKQSQTYKNNHSNDSNNNDRIEYINKYNNLKINKIENVLPKNYNHNKKIIQYKIKNYKEKINIIQNTENDRFAIINILTDNSLISVNIPNLKNGNDNISGKKNDNQITKIEINNRIFNFSNYVNNLNMDYKTMRKIELLNHYLNGKFYEYIEKWIRDFKSDNQKKAKIKKEKFLKMILIWDFDIHQEKNNTSMCLEKYKENIIKYISDEKQKNFLISLMMKIREKSILSHLKELIFEFLSEDVWYISNFSEEKEKLLFEKIGKFLRRYY